MNYIELFAVFHVDFLHGLIFDLEHRGHVSPKRRLTYNELHCVVYRTLQIFMK
jgi:hypothetical protein